MFYHADFYSECSVVGPVPQQRPSELQLLREQMQGGCAFLAGSVLAAHQEQRSTGSWGCAGRCPGHLQWWLWLSQEPRMVREGCLRSRGPPAAMGLLPRASGSLESWGRGESSRLQGKEGLGERTSEGNAHRKSQLCVKRNKGSPQSALLSQWALSAAQESPPVWPTPFHQCFTVHGPAPAGAATGTDRPCLSCASGRSCLSAPWLLWAGELRGKPAAPVP